jgi:hypothetical protein
MNSTIAKLLKKNKLNLPKIAIQVITKVSWSKIKQKKNAFIPAETSCGIFLPIGSCISPCTPPTRTNC